MMDESDEEETCKTNGQPSRKPNKNRKRELYDSLLFHDYWGPNPTYTNEDFRDSFRIPIELFNQFVARLPEHDPYFIQKRDACNKLGLSAGKRLLVL